MSALHIAALKAHFVLYITWAINTNFLIAAIQANCLVFLFVKDFKKF